MSKIYEFHDIFIKTCEYKDGVGDCKKKRESKKCVSGVCEKINIPETKLDVLDDYYTQIQKGGTKNYKCNNCNKTYITSSKLRHHKLKHDNPIFKCPENKCHYSTSQFDKFKKHVRGHKSEVSLIKYKPDNLEKDIEQIGKGNNDRPQPTNKSLYNYVKQLANKKFESKSGIYRSSWIVREYKKRGGKYSGKKSSSSGLKRWFKEKWVDLNRPIRNSKGKITGYKACGRSKIKGSKGKYPLCRPSTRVNKGSPRTYRSISSKSISKAKKDKSRIKSKGNIKFGRGYEPISGLVKKKISRKDFIDSRRQNPQNGGDCEMCQTGGQCDTCQLGSGKIRSQYYGRKSSIMIKVPKNVKNVALYSFKLKKLGFNGGIETGWKRAKQLATKESISIEDLKYMKAWFARHLYASYPSYKLWIKAGRPKDSKWHKKRGIISWLIWGGDAAFKWVNSKKNINLLNKTYNKSYIAIKLK